MTVQFNTYAYPGISDKTKPGKSYLLTRGA